MALAERPINPFERKDIRDYTKHTTLSAIRANCARAVELDDSHGAKKNGGYLLAMAGLADAIYAELGIKPESKAAPVEPVEPVDVKDSEEYKSLEVLLTSTQERSVEQEGELETLDKDVEDMAATIKGLREELAAKAPKAKAKSTTKKGAK